jgi:hypothetical protein
MDGRESKSPSPNSQGLEKREFRPNVAQQTNRANRLYANNLVLLWIEART